MIEVTNLTKNYGKVEALKGISFVVKPGEIYGLLGPNGAGKSTTINIISGLLRPSTGSASVGGFDIANSAIEAKKILGVVPQQSVMIEELSALQNCLFFRILLLSWLSIESGTINPMYPESFTSLSATSKNNS